MDGRHAVFAGSKKLMLALTYMDVRFAENAGAVFCHLLFFSTRCLMSFTSPL